MILAQENLLKIYLQKIEKLEAEVSRWKERAERDSLTGCLRRESFMELIASRRNFGLLQSQNTLVVVDIDHFKKVNDTYGHLAGDLALQHISQILKSRLPEGALLCRMGGEEFVMLLPDKLETNLNFLESLRLQIQHNPVKGPKGKRIPLSASFGAVTWNSESPFIKAVSEADLLLYKAKETGRNRIAA